MANSLIDRQELDTERVVVRNELSRAENNPVNVLGDHIEAAVFEWHGYGHRTLGLAADVERVSADRLRSFYRRYYRPDNAVLIVTGQFNESDVLTLVSKEFTKLSRPTEPIDAMYTVEPAQEGERIVTLRRPSGFQRVQAVYRIPAASHSDYAPLLVLAEIMRQTPRGRLHERLVAAGIADRVGSNAIQRADPGLITFGANVRNGSDLEQLKSALLATVEGLPDMPPTQEEVNRARNALLRGTKRALIDSADTGSALSTAISMGDWRLFFITRDRVRAVQPADVLRVARTYLKPSNRTVGLLFAAVKSDAVLIPGPGDLTTLLSEYKGGAPLEPGEQLDPSLPAVRKRLVQSRLSSGMKLLLLPKRTRGSAVHVALRLGYGNLESLRGWSAAASLLPGMLLRGTLRHSRGQLQDELSRLETVIDASPLGAGMTQVTVETTRAHLHEALSLLTEILRNPSFPASEFQELKRAALVQAEAGRTDPEQLAEAVLRMQLQRHFLDGDPRRVLSPDEQIAALKTVELSSVIHFYREFFGGTDAALSIVGDFAPEPIQAHAESLLGNWNSPKSYSPLQLTPLGDEPTHLALRTPGKPGAAFAAGWRVGLGDQHRDYAALLLGNFLFGGFNNSRLMNRLRKQDGLSYVTFSSLTNDPGQPASLLLALATCSPANVEKVAAAFREEVARIAGEGYDPAELENGRRALLGRRQALRSNDSGLATLLVRNAVAGRTLDDEAKLEDELSRLTAQQVLASWRRHIDQFAVSTVKAGDFDTKTER
jgi:zinc protease